MAETSARLKMPFLVPGQAQKETYHNEALTIIDMALNAAVESAPVATPPVSPSAGQCWVVAAGATGEWLGKDNCLVAWTPGGWRFLAPTPGSSAWNKAGGYWIHWNGTAWVDGAYPVRSIVVGGQQVVGSRQPSIADPSGGTIVDAEARAAINSIIVALRSHGLIS